MIGVSVGNKDRRYPGTRGCEDLLRLGSGVHDDIAFRGVDNVGVYLEAVHGEGDLLDLAQKEFLMLKGRAVARYPVDVVDVGDAPDLAHYLLDVLHAAGPEREPAEGRPVLDGVDAGGEDVHPGVGDGLGYVAEQVRAVQSLDQQLHGKKLAVAYRPLDLHEPLREIGRAHV